MRSLTSYEDVVALLGLELHPEGGFYRETFRDSHIDHAGRARSTAIYFLLPAGIISRWHRVDAAEAWHWYAGASMRLSETSGRVAPDRASARHMILGNNFAADERPQHVIPAYIWQQAQSLGAWTLAGCTVAPGFDFKGFELALGDTF